jgi:trigger factor
MQFLQQNNQLPAVFADVRRGMALAAAVRAASVSDTDGNAIETAEFFGNAPEAPSADDEADGTDGADGTVAAADDLVEAEAASDE